MEAIKGNNNNCEMKIVTSIIHVTMSERNFQDFFFKRFNFIFHIKLSHHQQTILVISIFTVYSINQYTRLSVLIKSYILLELFINDTNFDVCQKMESVK
jgi:hypothetical protein